MTSHQVLVVEDDFGLCDVLARGLREEGFGVVTASNGADAMHAVAHLRVDAIVLDVGLPDSDGRDVCQALRANGSDMPILFLTAKGDLVDKLSGFAAGGDDYLGKPFAFPELIARLRAVLRRAKERPMTAWGDIVLDPTTHALSCSTVRTALSPTEFRLLACLLAAPSAVVRRRELIDAAWPHGAIVSDNTLDQYVSKLRRKLGEVGSEQSIENARGVGYHLA